MSFKDILKNMIGLGGGNSEEIKISNDFNEDAFIEDLKNFKKEGYEIPPEMKNNKDFMFRAISVRRSCFDFISDELRQDKEFISKVVENGYCDLKELSEEMLSEKDIALRSITKHRESLRNFPKFNDDKDVVLGAVKNYPDNLFFTSLRLRGDNEVCLTAIEGCRSNLDFVTVFFHVSDELKNDKKFVLDALSIKIEAFEYLPLNMKNDEDVLLAASTLFNDPLQREQHQNKQWFIEALENYGVIQARFEREKELHQRLDEVEKAKVQQQSLSSQHSNTQRQQVRKKI